MDATTPITIERQIAAVRDELGKRKRLYPRWVRDGRMTREEAAGRIAAMEAVRETLERVRTEQKDRVDPGLF